MQIQENVKLKLEKKRTKRVMASATPCQGGAVPGSRGFTILELLIVVAIVGLLMTIAIPAFTEYKNMAKIARAKAEIRGILSQIAFYQSDKINLPPQLENLPAGIAIKDPWGNKYIYNIITTVNVDAAYKDSGGTVLNTVGSYDLYSKGADGQSTYFLLDDADNHSSMDDIVAGSDDSIVELGKDY